MPSGVFGGPRPFVSSSIHVSFIYNSSIDKTDVEIEQRLRKNGFTRADVRIDRSDADSRVKVSVITNEEEMSYTMVERLVGQVKDEINNKVNDRDINVFCT